jgi:hypothetical protein
MVEVTGLDAGTETVKTAELAAVTETAGQTEPVTVTEITGWTELDGMTAEGVRAAADGKGI